MRIETFAVGRLGCNCSILMESRSKQAIVVDPGGDFDEIQARLQVQVLHTPGHTPGICAFVAQLGPSQVASSGDTLFRRGIGRTDLWGGDSDLSVRSIKDKLYSLDDSVKVITSHGPSTTIGEEQRGNPFVHRR